MSFVGTILPAALGGVDPRDASVDKTRERRRAASRGAGKSRDPDLAEISGVAGVESAEGLRSVKGNVEEEAHEDRAEHGYYTPQGTTQPTPGEHPPKLDISG